MKIILCLHHFLPEYIGGTEIYSYNLAKHLSKAGMDVLVLIPNLGVAKTEEYYHEKIRVIKYWENSIEDRSMIKGFKKPSGLQEFREILIAEQPAIIHFQELAPGRGINICHVQVAHELNLRIFISFHLAQHTCIKGSLIYKDLERCDGKILIKKCSECLYHARGLTGIKAGILNNSAMMLYNLHLNTYKMDNSAGTALGFPYMIEKLKTDLKKLSAFSEKIIVLSEWYKKVLLLNQIPEHKIHLIKQALPNEYCDDKEKSKKIFSVPLRVVFVGRITKIKGVHIIIDAINKMPPGQISLDIYGPATDKEYLDFCKARSARLDTVYWKGEVSSNNIISILRNYDVLCIASEFEMSPLVIQEAFAAGIPVIASDVNGNSEQVKHGQNGWLFSSGDSEDLANVLKKVITNPQLMDSIKRNISEVRTFEQVANEHIGLYTIGSCLQPVKSE